MADGLVSAPRSTKCWRRAGRCFGCCACFTICVVSVLFLEILLSQNDAAVLEVFNTTSGTGTEERRTRKTIRKKLHNGVVTSASALCILLLAGHLLRRKSRWLRALHLPSSVIGGLVGWAFFAAFEAFGGDDLADEWVSVGWDVLPGFCTNIVFACLFLGTPVPGASVILASPRREHFIYGLIVVFGQYLVSCFITGIYRLFDPSLSPLFATVLPYGYSGGPVVAEAMKDLFAVDSFDYTDGYLLSLLCATVGMFVGVIAGAFLVNTAPLVSSHHADPALLPEADSASSSSARSSRHRSMARLRKTTKRLATVLRDLKEQAPSSDHYEPLGRPIAAEQTVSVDSLDSLMFHACLVSLVMLAGYILRIPFVLAEELFPTGGFFERSNLLSVLPLFLFVLVAGLGIQKVVDERFTDKHTDKSFIDRDFICRISNSAQDVLIVAAISRLGRNGLPPGVHGLVHFLRVVLSRGVPFIGVCLGGLAWGIASFWLIAPRLLPDFWAERALVEFGVSIGATSTGLLLLRMADPEGKTPVLRDFTFKQIFHVLITGGGFFDVIVPIPLTATSGTTWSLFGLVAAIIGLLLACHPASARRWRRWRNTPEPALQSGGCTTSSRARVSVELPVEMAGASECAEFSSVASAASSSGAAEERPSARPRAGVPAAKSAAPTCEIGEIVTVCSSPL